ncbi:MAG: AAA family ATPase [Chloroflexi bacterium]|nr:AAA family ATPase [Chloroflexota bacterium]
MARAQLPYLVRRLLDPAAYPHPVDGVELIQTHISYVFLAGDYVYKVKKPVDFRFLDYSTLRKRLYYCHQEVRLNSRLCPDTYLGVVAIREQGGAVRVEGPGRVLEYAMKMRRLPQERMLDRLLATGEADRTMVERLAERLARFHAGSESSPRIARYGDWAIRFAWRENFQQWADFVGETLTAEQDRLLRSYVRHFLRRNRDLMRRRRDTLRIRDCHGDLRSDSVCLVDGVCIYDRIEFSRRLRYTDVAGDVGFLAMDLEYRGRPDLAGALVARYGDASGDRELLRVLDFYRCYRACVRGKVEGFRLRQPEAGAREKRQALQAARRYFALACRYGERDRPLLIIMCGLTATGKSTLAQALSDELGVEVVSSDLVRKELAGVGPSERRFEPFGRGIYASRFSDRTYRALLRRAEGVLAGGGDAIVDASFARRRHRAWAKRTAERQGARFLCVECRAGDATVRQRLEERLRQGGDPSDARWEIYVGQKAIFEAVDELSPEEHVIIDSQWRLGQQVDAIQRKTGVTRQSLA